MFESLAVYLTLAGIMIICGVLVARRPSLSGGGDMLIASPVRPKKKYLLVFGDLGKDRVRRKRAKSDVRVPLSTEYAARFNCMEVWIPIVLFTFVFGCRWMVGVDYDEYLRQYMLDAEEHFEPLFQLLIHGLSSVGVHFSVFFSTVAFIEIFCIYYSLRNYKFLYPYVAFTLIIGFWFLSLSNILRQQLAACIFLNSIVFILERKPLKYYLLVLLAFLFHKSAILLVAVYPILAWREDWFRNIYVQLALFMVALYLSTHYETMVHMLEAPFNFVSGKLGYAQYSFGILFNDTLNNKSQFGANTGLGLPAQIIKYLPIILFSSRMKQFYNDRFFNVAYSIWFIGLFTLLAFGGSIVLTRPFIYAQNFLHIMPGFFFYYCFRTKKMLPIATATAIMALYLLLFYNLIDHGSLNTSAYTFFWQSV